MRDLLRALRRRYLTRGLTPEERARLDALPAARWPTPEEFALDVDDLRARFVAQLDRKIRARVQDDDLTRARAELATGLIPATPENVTATLYPPADPEATARFAAAREAERVRHEEERLDRERVTYTIDLSHRQWLLLVKHGYDPTLPPNGMRSGGPGPVHGWTIGHVDRSPHPVTVYRPLRNGVCELEGVEIDGHEASDLDPWGGCMHCGKQEIYGEGEDGRPLRFDGYLDDDPEERELGETELAEAAREDASVWPFAEGPGR